MRSSALLTAWALAVGVSSIAAEAAADNLDPALNRLVLDQRCRTSGPNGSGSFYDPASQYVRCEPNDEAFAKLIAQYGFALAPTADYAARTTGFGGFKLAIEADYTNIDSKADYWQRGTQGPQDKSTKLDSITGDPPGWVQTYAVKLAKGFPFGLELGGTFGWLANSNIVSGGADVRVALFEGFRDSIPGYFPDIGVAGGVRTITGTSQFKLTVASFDAQMSKPIHIAGTVILQPHVGYQWVRIFGDSDLVDLTPNTDAITHCGYSGDNTPATPDPTKTVLDGQPVCSGSSADFNNSVVFDPVRLTRHRINFGAQLRYQMVYFGIHALTDVVAPAAANKDERQVLDPRDPSKRTRIALNPFADDPRTPGDDEVKRQWTVAVDLGAVF